MKTHTYSRTNLITNQALNPSIHRTDVIFWSCHSFLFAQKPNNWTTS